MRAVGATQQTSITFSQDDFDEFARLSGDDNPIHVDPEFSARTRFGRTVAHGMLLFGTLSAATTRWLGDSATTATQELMFTAPTYAGESVEVDLAVIAADTSGTDVAQRMVKNGDVQTCVGSVALGVAAEPAPADPAVPVDSGEPWRGVEVGMIAEMVRVFTTADVADYLALVDDPSARYRGANAVVPPPLLGGLVSCLLGMELPGRGTNWLKQRYAFHHSVSPAEPVTGRVEITRLRPDKALVNLRTECSTPSHGTVVSGEALVLVADLAR